MKVMLETLLFQKFTEFLLRLEDIARHPDEFGAVLGESGNIVASSIHEYNRDPLITQHPNDPEPLHVPADNHGTLHALIT
jgi:hypothetical protein